MTSRERLIAALQGAPTDRVPVSLYEFSHFDRHRPADEPGYAGLIDLQRQMGDCVVNVDLDLGLSVGDPNTVHEGGNRLDQAEVSTVTLQTPRGPLSSVARRDPGNITFWQIKPLLANAEDCRKWLSLPEKDVDPDPRPILDMQRKVGEQGVVWYGPGDALGLVCGLFHYDGFLMTLLEDEGLILEMLRVVSGRLNRGLTRLCAKVKNVGIRFWGPEYSGAPLLNPAKYFEKLVMQFDREPIRIAKESGNFAIVHCHGCLGELLDYLLELAPTALEPLEVAPAVTANVTMQQLKSRLGGKMCLMGGMEATELELANSAEVARRTREIMEQAAPGGRYIMIPTAAPIDYPLRPALVDNYRAWFETVRQYGKY